MKRNKPFKIEIPGKLIKQFGKNQLIQPKGYKEYVIQNNKFKKNDKTKEKEQISQIKESRIDHIFFKDDGLSSVHIHVTLKELKQMMKKLEKDAVKFKSWGKGSICIRNLSQDVSFIVNYKK